MFTGKLSVVTGIDQTVLQTLKNSYSEPEKWNSKDSIVTDFKKNMKKLLNDNQKGRCAYCGLPLATRCPEIEHIAPKGGPKQPKHTECMFDPQNLVYACHWCNSPSCKGKKDTVSSKNGSSNCKDWTYLLVHPYFDDASDFFEMNILKDGRQGPIPMAKRGIDLSHRRKAEFTIEMFKLHSEGVMSELAKQAIQDQDPDEINRMVDYTSTFRPD